MNKSKLGNYDELFVYSGNASSPNGGHSSVNYLADAAAVKKDPKLRDAIYELTQHFKYGKEFCDIVDILFVNIDEEYARDKIHSRLVTFTAPGGKSRVIAIGDWLTQTALSAIHKTQFRLLEQIPSDCTFDHRAGLNLYNENADCYHSVDLSAATDRFPRALQARLIERIFIKLGMDGASIAANWDKIIDREYSTKGSLLEKASQGARYAVGQGMGLFSSWSSMALVHHYIVHELAGCPFDNYVLVGDDLLMKDSAHAYSLYTDIMTQIGVGVNPAKTLISTSQPHSLEFARNFIVKGINVRPLPCGTVFAYLDGKIGALEAFCAFGTNIRSINVFELIKYLKIKDPLQLTDIAYFMLRDKLSVYTDIKSLVESFGIRLIVTEAHFRGIIRIMSNSKYSPPARMQMTKLTQTLQSQCTITKADDMNKLSSLALDFACLKFAGENIEDYSQKMHDRMNNAHLIEYDCEHAVSVVSKREHRLIRDLMKLLEKSSKDIRAGKRRIR